MNHLETEHFEFGTLKIGDRFIIGEMKEGADIRIDAAAEVMRVAEERFEGQKWGYISHRINSYSLQPTVYFETSNVDTQFAAMAVVTSRESQEKQANFEKQVSPGPYKFECFGDLPSAIDWVSGVLAEESSAA